MRDADLIAVLDEGRLVASARTRRSSPTRACTGSCIPNRNSGPATEGQPAVILRFRLSGFLKNLRLFEAFLVLALLDRS